jgi:phage terminase large subunit GpA-like protein
MDRIQETLDNVVLRFYQPRKKMKVWEWIDQNCELPPESGAKLKGKFRTSITPYTRGIYEAYGDHTVRFITLAKSAQVGGTTILKNLVLWDIENKPGPSLYVTANEKMAKRFNDRELEPHFHIAPLWNS